MKAHARQSEQFCDPEGDGRPHVEVAQVAGPGDGSEIRDRRDWQEKR